MSPSKEELSLDTAAMVEPMQSEVSGTAADQTCDNDDVASTTTSTSSTTDTKTAKATRRTPATALKRTCEPCTQAKVKCDGQSPCTRCTRRQEVSSCVFRAQKKRGRRVQVLNHHQHHSHRRTTPGLTSAENSGASFASRVDMHSPVAGFFPNKNNNRAASVGLGMNNLQPQQHQQQRQGLGDQVMAAFLANNNLNNGNNDGATNNSWHHHHSASNTIALPYGQHDQPSLILPQRQQTPPSLVRAVGLSSSPFSIGTPVGSPRNSDDSGNSSGRSRFQQRRAGSLGMQGASLGTCRDDPVFGGGNRLVSLAQQLNVNSGGGGGRSGAGTPVVGANINSTMNNNVSITNVGIPNHEPFRPANQNNEQLALQRGQTQAMRHAHTFGTERRVQILAAKLSAQTLKRPDRVSVRTFLLTLKQMLEPSVASNNHDVLLNAQLANLRRYLVSCRSQAALQALDAWAASMRFPALSTSPSSTDIGGGPGPAMPPSMMSPSTSSSSLYAMLGVIGNSAPSTPGSAGANSPMTSSSSNSSSSEDIARQPSRHRGGGGVGTEALQDPSSVAVECFARVFGKPEGERGHDVDNPAVLTFREVLSKSPESGERFAMSCNTALVRLVGQPAMNKLRAGKLGLLPWGGDLLAHLLVDEDDLLLIQESIAEKLARIRVDTLPCRREVVLSQLCAFRIVQPVAPAPTSTSTASVTVTRCMLRCVVIEELCSVNDTRPSTVTVHFSITPQASSLSSIAPSGSPPKRLKTAGSAFNVSGEGGLMGSSDGSTSGGSGLQHDRVSELLPTYARVHLCASEFHSVKRRGYPKVTDPNTESDYVWLRNLLAFVSPNMQTRRSHVGNNDDDDDTITKSGNNLGQHGNTTSSPSMGLPLSMSSTSLSASVPMPNSFSSASLSALLPTSMPPAMPTSLSSSSISSLSSAFNGSTGFRGTLTPSSSNSPTSVAPLLVFPDNNNFNNNNNNNFNNNSIGRAWQQQPQLSQRLLSQSTSPIGSNAPNSFGGPSMSSTPRANHTLLGPSPGALAGGNNNSMDASSAIAAMDAITQLSRKSSASSAQFGIDS